MTLVLNLIDVEADTFEDLTDRVNQLVAASGANYMTVNAAANGSASIGNGFVVGILSATTLAAAGLRGGNVQTSNTLNLNSNVSLNAAFSFIAGNIVVNTTVLSVGANIVVNTSVLSIGNSTVNSTLNSSAFSTNVLNYTTGSAANSLSVGSNLTLNTTSIFLGNATANLFANSILVKVANSTGIANLQPTQLVIGGAVLNATSLVVGANVTLDTTHLLIGNSTVNVTSNSTVLSIGANVTVDSVKFASGNSTANLVANSVLIKVANSTSTANLDPLKLVIGVSTVNSIAISVGSNIVANSTSLKIDSMVSRPVTVTTTGTSAQELDAIALATFRSVEYTLTVTDNNANNYQISKLLMIQDGGAAYLTEYGILRSNSAMGTFATGSNATHFTLTYTPVSTNTTVKGIGATALV